VALIKEKIKGMGHMDSLSTHTKSSSNLRVLKQEDTMLLMDHQVCNYHSNMEVDKDLRFIQADRHQVVKEQIQLFKVHITLIAMESKDSQ
jgi:hypothetical protein